jgi:hypothetical protein
MTSKTHPNDIIQSPAHYIDGRQFEPISVIQDWGLLQNHHLACALKYIARAGRKNDALTDVKKAIWYLQREAEKLENDARNSSPHHQP